ncbi:Armadillo-type fold [Plasmopara halstedii]|uniref:Armadillo-type fold n=1 Tax=Plasmopara halstedii TaxID=4781 RepID=A0A0P1AWA4_PLAHL|nr:Armadillo-type fold [Plasmopara halstedii]CEG45652.1 Armadillo-type fold [Plasmopara halstedii]|eukprot:XP_024582021.1 Armadillo-type fold [Plasmopara halstedii]
MAEQLTACARQLFEGVPGSSEQKAANAWLMEFQKSDEAWQAALQLLKTPARNPQTQQILAAPELMAMQILRLKTQNQWTHINEHQQEMVWQTLLKLLKTTCVADGGLSASSCRIACATLADIVVKCCTTWTGWKSDVQHLINAGVAAQRQGIAATMLVDILGAIPMQIRASERMWTEEEMHVKLTGLQAEGEEVMTAVQMILTNITGETSSALRCLEGWVVGCVPSNEAFGLTIAHLFTRGLIDVLLTLVISDNEEHSQLAADIVADSVVTTHIEPASECLISAVLHTSHCLVRMIALFQADAYFSTGKAMIKEQQKIVCGCISRIACSLALNHARTLFSKQAGASKIGSKDCNFRNLSTEFLELLLACSSFDDIDVVQPTLEFWFFFLEANLTDDISWQFRDAAGQEFVVSILSRLVTALIEQCKYPRWFVESQQIMSDDPEIEAISTLRREIADTLLSLFYKWPKRSHEFEANHVSCVKGLCQLLSGCKDIALIDALLFLLSYMIELFDVSSDLGSKEDSDSSPDPTFDGVNVLLEVLKCTVNLPIHPLTINGVARYLRTLSISLALPANVNLHTSMVICQGLQYKSSFSVAVQSLLHSSASLTKYTTFEERTQLLHELIHYCSTLQNKITQESEGNLLEVTFRMSSGASSADFGAICSTVLYSLIASAQRGNSIEGSRSIYLLGRALSGVQDQEHGYALVDQLWAVVAASLLRHTGDESYRRAGVVFFINVVSHLQKGYGPIEAQILDLCLCWYGDSIAPDVLTCCSHIFARQQNNTDFLVSAEHNFKHLVGGFCGKLHQVSGAKSCDDNVSMTIYLSQHPKASDVILEIKEFLGLAREVLNYYPQNLSKLRPNGEPSLYWVCLDLATSLVRLDHKETCDAACQFLLGAMHCQSELILENIKMFTIEIVRIVLSFLDPSRKHNYVRSLWDFFYQCIHAPDISIQIRGSFLTAVSTVVLEEGLLRSILSNQMCQNLPGELEKRRQRHRFRLYFTELGHAADAANSSII